MPTPHEQLTEALLRGADELTGTARRLQIDQVTLARWLTCYDTKQAVASMRHQCDLQASIALSRMRLHAIHHLAQLASQTEQHPETARKAAVTLLTAELDGRAAAPPGRLDRPDPNRRRPLLPDRQTADDGNPLDPTPADATPPADATAPDAGSVAPEHTVTSPSRPLSALIAEAWDDEAPDDAPADDHHAHDHRDAADARHDDDDDDDNPTPPPAPPPSSPMSQDEPSDDAPAPPGENVCEMVGRASRPSIGRSPIQDWRRDDALTGGTPVPPQDTSHTRSEAAEAGGRAEPARSTEGQGAVDRSMPERIRAAEAKRRQWRRRAGIQPAQPPAEPAPPTAHPRDGPPPVR